MLASSQRASPFMPGLTLGVGSNLVTPVFSTGSGLGSAVETDFLCAGAGSSSHYR